MESREPLHRVGRCRADSAGARGGEAGGSAARRGAIRVRRRVHVGAQARDQDAVDGARGDGPDVDTRASLLALERAPLRRAAGAQQGGDRGEVRRRAGEDLAPRLRHAAAAARGRRPAHRGRRPALRRHRPARISAHRMPEGHGGALPPVLALGDRAGDTHGQERHHRSARQQPARTGQVSRRRLGRRHRRAQHSDRASRWCTSSIVELRPIRSYYLGDDAQIKAKMEAVANQGKAPPP